MSRTIRPVLDRLALHYSVDEDTQCWIWHGWVNSRGAPITTINRKQKRAYRVAYIAKNGFISDDILLTSTCHQRLCINPDHRKPTTAKALGSISGTLARTLRCKGILTHCIHGHEFTADNTSYNEHGYRRCRQCRRESSRRQEERKRALGIIQTRKGRVHVNVSASVRFTVLERDGFRCQYCGRSAPVVVLEVDHIVPKSQGGLATLDNLRTACMDCNRGKRARPLVDDRCSRYAASTARFEFGESG